MPKQYTMGIVINPVLYRSGSGIRHETIALIGRT